MGTPNVLCEGEDIAACDLFEIHDEASAK